METNSVFVTILVLLIIGYVFVYFGGRKYLELFENQQPIKSNRNNVPDKPFSINPINNADDYEVSAVFQNQVSREASKKELNDAMTRYP